MRKSVWGLCALVLSALCSLLGLGLTLFRYPSLPEVLPESGVGKPMLFYLPALSLILWLLLSLASLRARRLEFKLPLPARALPGAQEALSEYLRLLSLPSSLGFLYASLALSGGGRIAWWAYLLLLLALLLVSGFFLFRLIRLAKRQGVSPDEPDEEEGRKIIEDFMKDYRDHEPRA